MSRATYAVHRNFIESGFETGAEHQVTTIKDGLPPNARLTYATLRDDVLYLTFEHEDFIFDSNSNSKYVRAFVLESRPTQRLVTDAETRGMLAAAKLICAHCLADEPITIDFFVGEFVSHGTHPCLAWKIRAQARLREG